MKLKKLFHWTVIAPILAWAIYFLTPDSDSTVILMLCGVFFNVKCVFCSTPFRSHRT